MKGQRTQFNFQDVTIEAKVLQYIDFPSLASLQLVNRNWRDAVQRGNRLCFSALRHLYGKETMQRMQLYPPPSTAMTCPQSLTQHNRNGNAVVSPEKSWTTMPCWSLLCDHIFSLHSFFVDGTHVTTSLAVAIMRDFMLFLSTGNSPTGATKEEVQALCNDCGLLACTAVSIAIKVEEGLTAQWDKCPIPSRAYGDITATREKVISAERLLLGCLSFFIPVNHFGQYSFPMRLQLIKADEEYRRMRNTNTLGMISPSRSIPPRLSLTSQKALLQFVHHSFARSVNYVELSADPALQALCALLFTLALMSIVHNHQQTAQQQASACNTTTATTTAAAGTWGMNVLKQGLVAALLVADVTPVASEAPRHALVVVQHCFDALVLALQELHRLEVHVLASHGPDETPRTRGQGRASASRSQHLSSDDVVLVTAYRTIFAPPYSAGQVPYPLSSDGSNLVTLLTTISPDMLKTSHTQVTDCLDHTWRRLIHEMR